MRKKLLIGFGIGVPLVVLTLWLPSGALVGGGPSAERPGPSPKERHASASPPRSSQPCFTPSVTAQQSALSSLPPT